MTKINEVLLEITRDIKQIYKQLDDVALTGIPDVSGTVPAAGVQYNHLEDNGANWISVTNLTFPDDATLGLPAGGNFQFDSTPDPDQLILNSLDLNLSGNDFYAPDNTADAFKWLDDGGLEYLRLTTTDAQPAIDFNAGGADIDFHVRASGVADALQVQGNDGQITLGALGTGIVQATAGVLSIATGGVVPGPLAVGDTIVATAGPLWDILTTPGAAGYARVSTATTEVWSLTPAWLGEHLFNDGVAFTGASDANELTIPDNLAIGFEIEDAGGIEYLRIVSTDAQPVIDFNTGGADVDFNIRASGVTNALAVQGSDGFVGLGTSTPTDELHMTSATGTRPVLTIECTNAGQTAGFLNFYHNSASPADTDTLGTVAWSGETSTGALKNYSSLRGGSPDVTNGSAGGSIFLQVAMNNFMRNLLTVTGYNGSVDQGEVTVNEDGQDVDFRVEASGKTHSLFVDGASGFVGINESANASMTIGLTIDQAANDDEILNLRSSDVGAVLSVVETGTYGMARKAEGSAGGLFIGGYKDSDGTNRGAVQLAAYLEENTDVVKTTSARGIMEFYGYQTDATNVENTVANGNILAIRTQRGGSTVTTHWFDEDGDFGYDGSLTPYDHLEDSVMARDLQRVLTGRQGVHYNQDAMIEAGILHPSKHGVMVSHKKMTALQLGAHAQAYEDRRALEQRIKQLEEQLKQWQ